MAATRTRIVQSERSGSVSNPTPNETIAREAATEIVKSWHCVDLRTGKEIEIKPPIFLYTNVILSAITTATKPLQESLDKASFENTQLEFCVELLQQDIGRVKLSLVAAEAAIKVKDEALSHLKPFCSCSSNIPVIVHSDYCTITRYNKALSTTPSTALAELLKPTIELLFSELSGKVVSARSERSKFVL